MNEVIVSTASAISPEIAGAVNDFLRTALQAVMLFAVSGATWAIRIWLKSMHSGWKRTVAERLVSFAQQRIPTNSDKFDYVAKQLHRQFPRLSEDEYAHLIEEAVVNLKTKLPTK